MKWRHRCPSLFCGVCMIAGCWLGSAYVLVVHGGRAAAQNPELIPALTATKPPATETPSPAADAVNRCVDWELTKVLVEIDIRNPSPEHEAFLREYDRIQNRCKKGE